MIDDASPENVNNLEVDASQLISILASSYQEFVE